MGTAAVDILGYLPGPASKANMGACAMFGGEAFAFGVASAVAVIDVRLINPPAITNFSAPASSSPPVIIMLPPLVMFLPLLQRVPPSFR